MKVSIKIILFSLSLVFFYNCSSQPILVENTTETQNTTRINNIFNLPAPNNYVNDYSFLLTSNERSILENKLSSFDKKTTNQIIILTLDSDELDENNFDDFAFDISNSWGVGTKEKNNGLTIILSPVLRKIRISTGIGTQKIISDQMCVDIIEQIIVPEFKEENYFKGLDDATDEIIKIWEAGM